MTHSPTWIQEMLAHLKMITKNHFEDDSEYDDADVVGDDVGGDNGDDYCDGHDAYTDVSGTIPQ